MSFHFAPIAPSRADEVSPLQCCVQVTSSEGGGRIVAGAVGAGEEGEGGLAQDTHRLGGGGGGGARGEGA